MPTITTVDTTWTNGVAMDEAELRRADSAMFLGDGSNNGVRGGIVYHGPNSLAVSINGSDQVAVQSGAAVIPAATGLGVYRASLQAATAATAIDSRNATNPRIDLVVFRSTGAVDIITGTPGASPSAPALPAQAVELGRINVPATGGGAATVSNAFRQYATALGGTIYVESSARLPGSGSIKGQEAVALDTGRAWTWDGGAWSTVGGWKVSGFGFPNLPVNASTSWMRFVEHGNTVHLTARANVTGPASGIVYMNLPVPISSAVTADLAQTLHGNATAFNAGVGPVVGVPVIDNSTRIQFHSMTSATAWDNATPHTWKNGDNLVVNLTYERA